MVHTISTTSGTPLEKQLGFVNIGRTGIVANISPDGTHAVFGLNTNFNVITTANVQTLWTGGLPPYMVTSGTFISNDGELAIWQLQWGEIPPGSHKYKPVYSFLELWDINGKKIWGVNLWPAFRAAVPTPVLMSEQYIDIVSTIGLLRYANGGQNEIR